MKLYILICIHILIFTTHLYAKPVLKISSMENLKKLSKQINGEKIFLKGYYTNTNLGSGLFVWNLNSTKQQDDGLIIKANSLKKGRWERQGVNKEDIIKIELFGAIPNDQKADSKAIQNAINSGYNLKFNSGKYKINEIINFKKSNRRYIGNKTIFNIHNKNGAFKITSFTSNIIISNIIFDGNNQEYKDGFFSYINKNTFNINIENCTFKNLFGKKTRRTYALFISANNVKKADINKCVFQNITQYGDGKKIHKGFCGGIYLSLINKDKNVSEASKIIIQNSFFENIYNRKSGFDKKTGMSGKYNKVDDYDADAIRVYIGKNFIGKKNEIEITINNCTFTNIQKSAIKIRGAKTYINHCTVCSNRKDISMYAGFRINKGELFYIKNIFMKGNILNGIVSNSNNTKIENFTFISNTSKVQNGIQLGIKDTINNIYLKDILIKNALYGINIKSANNISINNFTIFHGNKIKYRNANNVIIDDKVKIRKK